MQRLQSKAMRQPVRLEPPPDSLKLQLIELRLYYQQLKQEYLRLAALAQEKLDHLEALLAGCQLTPINPELNDIGEPLLPIPNSNVGLLQCATPPVADTGLDGLLASTLSATTQENAVTVNSSVTDTTDNNKQPSIPFGLIRLAGIQLKDEYRNISTVIEAIRLILHQKKPSPLNTIQILQELFGLQQIQDLQRADKAAYRRVFGAISNTLVQGNLKQGWVRAKSGFYRAKD